jgi:hypothetical protein
MTLRRAAVANHGTPTRLRDAADSVVLGDSAASRPSIDGKSLQVGSLFRPDSP